MDLTPEVQLCKVRLEEWPEMKATEMTDAATRPLRVGVVGLNVGDSWAKCSHVPAIQSLPDLEFAAIATHQEKSARAAAEAFGLERWFADPLAMIQGENIDVVSVSVKVPEHREIVLAALAAGKHVYCEWPLGRGAEEAEEMAVAAKRAGVHTAIGLEGRANPAARRARELVSQGAIGLPLTARLVGATVGFGPVYPSTHAYFDDPDSGANLTTIQGGHALDLTLFVLGKLNEVEAMSSIQFRELRFTDTGASATRTVPDNLLILARFENGCAASVQITGGQAAPWPFLFEIVGTAGHLALSGGDRHGFQGGDLCLRRDGKPEKTDAPVVAGLSGPPLNLAESYIQFERDIRSGTRTMPDFDHATRLTRLLDLVSWAARTGVRQSVSEWALWNPDNHGPNEAK